MIALNGDAVGAHAPTIEDIIPREYIEEVRAYHEELAQVKARAEWQHTKRALSALEKRQPAQNTCHEGETWIQRECRSDVSPRAWQDECEPPDAFAINRPGECPENTVFVQLTIPNGVDVENEEIFIEDIICQPSTPPRQDVRTTRRQYGYRPYKAAGKEIVGFPVEVLEDNPHAVVSADILSSDRTFVIKPISTLTANLRGFDLKLCQQDPGNTLLNSRQCVATGRPKNLRSGQFIDFTFALSPGQDGFLFYSIA
ncbi:hypothetical protein PTT_08563 [Pyrenophora teres f. teres 0-1]|uniref:Uncharacterized protein n=2 Tax=Pyrenophora teres f. teres TaxID=97479 RepID=E3RK31_PYRTT|nr:hypothetical protein PTT_08563 [Pyrenophora teres f. teres 0-1]KAE8834228.1 hypothetical protein HRS9122_08308 [Pyrenophora teres f. teres]CAE7220443.1 hypothetical protein PTTW11_11312 [Pyrenophora teres f. teres]